MFHMAMLEPYRPNTIPGRVEPPPPPIDIEENIYKVESIRDSKVIRKKVYYLVHWKGYGSDNDTWEPGENLIEGGEEAVHEFHSTHRHAPRHSLFK